MVLLFYHMIVWPAITITRISKNFNFRHTLTNFFLFLGLNTKDMIAPDWKAWQIHKQLYNTSMLSAKVMPYLLRLAAPLLNSSIVQTLESFKVSFFFHPAASQSSSAPYSVSCPNLKKSMLQLTSLPWF